ncbi:Hydrolase (HAD superfamily) [Bacillus thuringiensis serovar israelensis ATCC 35646]|nr:Hydrolase (HAD superfamily) [Bacillus thuringiensis serovar israelensis ATCC 35646]
MMSKMLRHYAASPRQNVILCFASGSIASCTLQALMKAVKIKIYHRISVKWVFKSYNTNEN